MSTFEISRHELAKILAGNKRVAVVGMSDDPMRAGYSAGKYLQGKGFDISSMLCFGVKGGVDAHSLRLNFVPPCQ